MHLTEAELTRIERMFVEGRISCDPETLSSTDTMMLRIASRVARTAAVPRPRPQSHPAEADRARPPEENALHTLDELIAMRQALIENLAAAPPRVE